MIWLFDGVSGIKRTSFSAWHIEAGMAYNAAGRWQLTNSRETPNAQFHQEGRTDDYFRVNDPKEQCTLLNIHAPAT